MVTLELQRRLPGRTIGDIAVLYTLYTVPVAPKVIRCCDVPIAAIETMVTTCPTVAAKVNLDEPCLSPIGPQGDVSWPEHTHSRRREGNPLRFSIVFSIAIVARANTKSGHVEKAGSLESEKYKTRA